MDESCMVLNSAHIDIKTKNYKKKEIEPMKSKPRKEETAWETQECKGG
jgi:hypothetical protein